VDTIRELNPELRRWTSPPNRRGYSLRVPEGRGDAFRAGYASLPAEKRLLFKEHRVRSGDTLWRIASRYGVTIGDLRAANGISNPRRLRVGQVLRIPIGGGSAAPRASYASARSTSGKPSVHVVRRGDTLTTIARRYGTSARRIQRDNGLRSANRIYPGQRLKIGSSASSTPPVASAKSNRSPVVHRVRKGDTLYRIAQNYGTTVQSILRWNSLRSARIIHPGQVIRIYAD
jgi:membrane-bound lytic murein transglycosylase D